MREQKCSLCPRKCGVDRTKEYGFCGGGSHIKVARAALHHWEEPCISGERGSGTVFFSGCPLRCCFCQNHQISVENFGAEISIARLVQIFLELQDQGAHNINLVTPTHYVPWIIPALQQAKPQLKIPIVYNTGAYETVETLSLLEGMVDIYLPDFKYVSTEKSVRYSGAANYFLVASQAIMEMYRQVGQCVLGEDGTLKKGLIIRHLVLPKGREDSMAVLDWIARSLPLEEIQISLMSQYTPCYRSGSFPEINRRVSTFEYETVLKHAQYLGMQGFMQERSAAKEEYTPPFDLEGVKTRPREMPVHVEEWQK